MDTTVRRAQRSDAGDLGALVELYWAFEGIAGFDCERTAQNLATLLSLPDRGACWIAEREGMSCAYLIAVYVFSLEHGGMMAEIDEFFVRPEYRSCGTGSTLLDHAERELRAAGCMRVQLQLGVNNRRAREFYERHGYRSRSGYELLDKSMRSGGESPLAD